MYEKASFKSLQISEHCKLHKYNSNGGKKCITFAGFIIFHYKLHVSVLFKWNCTWLKDQWPFGH